MSTPKPPPDLATNLLRELVRTMALGYTTNFERTADAIAFANAHRAAAEYLAELAQKRDSK